MLNQVFVPNAFSPNQDGRNDAWEIINIEAYPDCRVRIFNNWGNLIYESVGYQEPWDGTFRGKEVPSGAYRYIIFLDEQEELIKGSLVIMR